MLYCGVKRSDMNLAVSEVLTYLRSISLNFSQIMNLTLSTETFIEAYDASDRLKEIFVAEYSDADQPADIEAEMDKTVAEEVSIFKSMKNNAIGVFLRSGQGIKAQQLQEFTSNGGMKPDINGCTVPKVINGNQLVRGMRTPSNMYLDATGARKSYIMNKKVMGKAGYYAKSLTIISTNVRMSDRVKNCGTHHYLKIYISDKAFLKKYEGRYYTLDPNDHDNLQCVHSNEDDYLIGKTVYFRSPIFCACRPIHGRRTFCHKCFGANARLNVDIAGGISIYLTEEITKVVNQNILSAKHLLTTRSEKIEFSDKFYDIFSFAGGEIRVRDNVELDVNDYELYIPESMLCHEDIYDDTNDLNTYINQPFAFRRHDGTDEVTISVLNEKHLYLSKELVKLIKENEGVVNLIDIADENYVMRVDIANNELTKPLYEIMELTSKDGIPASADDMAQTYTKLIIDAKIAASAIAGEVVVTALMRVPGTNEYPNFKFDGEVPYELIPLNRALTTNKSVLSGLIYQNLKNQLLSPNSGNRDGESIHDILFSEQVSTESLREFYKKEYTTID
jgi:hypothetical protein